MFHFSGLEVASRKLPLFIVSLSIDCLLSPLV